MITVKSIAGLSAAALFGAAVSIAGTSFAQSAGPAPAAKTTSVKYDIDPDAAFSDVRARLASQGFEARKIEFDDGKIEVKGLNADGRCMEIYFHPGTGEELRRERDDDCHRRATSYSRSSDSLYGSDDWDDDRSGRRGDDDRYDD